MKKLTIKAFAKINLGLRVLGRRDDGYHEIETFFQSIDLHDTLTLTLEGKPRIDLSVQSPWSLPEKENLVYRAAELMASEVESFQSVRIHLKKRIPVGAGLGGGSSDAAATLVGLHKLLRLKLGHTELHKLALSLGSDVPYFLLGGLCLGRGRGEILERLAPGFGDYTFLLVKPEFSLSTEELYRLYDLLTAQRWQSGSTPFWLSHQLTCSNDLEEAATRLRPELCECRRELAELKPDLLGMSGSGPTYYAGWRSEARAEQAAKDLEKLRYLIWRVRPTRMGYQVCTTRHPV